MGIEIAREALMRGADVSLVYGPGIITPPNRARTTNVETTEEMYEAVVSELESHDYDLVIATAAASDWTPKQQCDYKIPTRKTSGFDLKLKPTPKIIDRVKKINPAIFLVPFKAEYGLSNKELVSHAYETLKKAKADLIVANDVAKEGVGFGVETNELYIIDKERRVIHVPLTTKREAARELLNLIVTKLNVRAKSNE